MLTEYEEHEWSCEYRSRIIGKVLGISYHCFCADWSLITSVWICACCPAGGIAAYQSFPWGNMYNQPAIHQRTQCPSTYPASMGAARDHQPPSSTHLPPPSFYPHGDLGLSHTNSQCSSHTTTTTPSSTTTILPPVSTLRPSHHRAESTPTKVSSLLPSQVSPASPESPPVPPCVKIEYESPQEIHSHFHCDFSPIHFWLHCWMRLRVCV